VADKVLEEPLPPAQREAAERRRWGEDQTGTVGLRDFDQGIVETLGAFVQDQRYWLTVDGVDAPPGRPGVLVTFSWPEDEYKSYVVPMVLIRRDDIAQAMERWHPSKQTYVTPPREALKVKLPTDDTVFSGREGHDRMEVGFQATPFDISYTISAVAHYRGAIGQRGQVQLVFHEILKTYGHYGKVEVHDSLGDPRYYNTFMQGTSVLDEHSEIADRIIGLALSLRVEAELDLFSPAVHRTVTQPPTLTVSLKEL